MIGVVCFKQSTEKLQLKFQLSFQVPAPKLFNCLPKEILNKTKCSVDDFKADLEPKVTGSHYTPAASDLFSAQASNSVIDQIRKLKNGG